MLIQKIVEELQNIPEEKLAQLVIILTEILGLMQEIDRIISVFTL